jgi:type VI secretion system protein ImpK
VFSGIQAIRVATAAPPPPKPAPRPRLAPFLATEISQGLVGVRDDEGRSTVTLRGDRLFAPGSASIAPEFEPLIARIGEALNGVPGKVLVTGHTDNQPIRTARFPSNWHLSEERARSVAQQLAAVVPAARLSAEGRADGEPIASNDTPADRARNRRVEITLIPDRSAAGK